MAPGGHDSTHAAQKMHRPRSSASGWLAGVVIATVGHTSAHSRQPLAHWVTSTRNEPPCRSGSAGAGPCGYAIVSQPRFSRWVSVSRTNMVEETKGLRDQGTKGPGGVAVLWSL